ncbi:putative plant self-incompatibility S1 [Lupinus albus]|uniref:S-protein homolog n=1 Tax=Lupinus albus TaxID=3870 RepID=A0A6A4P5N0_LUPAL|nr:putative plant self-incompatibility S1 [Lupinus albus]
MGVSEEGWNLKYRHVYIKNGLGNDTLLIYHCKSKDDDVGLKTLNYEDEFKFQFRPSFFTITVFRCSFAWDGKSHFFNIYDFSRDENNCRDYYWSIMPNRPCRFNFYTRNYYICTFDYF